MRSRNAEFGLVLIDSSICLTTSLSIAICFDGRGYSCLRLGSIETGVDSGAATSIRPRVKRRTKNTRIKPEVAIPPAARRRDTLEDPGNEGVFDTSGLSCRWFSFDGQTRTRTASSHTGASRPSPCKRRRWTVVSSGPPSSKNLKAANSRDPTPFIDLRSVARRRPRVVRG
jgi:hypothetical protein